MIRAKSLVLRDEVHGDIVFDPAIRQAIDHPLFQRLRSIKQLGLAEYVFPCATHSRFQHSLGAAFLAGAYLRSVLEGWGQSTSSGELECAGTRLFPEKTRRVCLDVAEHAPSFEFWSTVMTLSALLHDVGHGPLSHTFESLDIPLTLGRELESLTGSRAEFLKGRVASSTSLLHEDIAILYVEEIVQDLISLGLLQREAPYALAIAGLIHRKFAFSDRATFARELGEGLRRTGLLGGIEFHSLLGPLISGPFDVDRMDYVQRDGRNCGVSIGGIEWRRIVSRVLPCLAAHPNEHSEPEDVVLFTHVRNQHVLDDFVFSLFQMYTQVYMHPKIVALEEEIRGTIQKSLQGRKLSVTLEEYARLSDESFLLMLEGQHVPVLKLLRRADGHRFRVANWVASKEMQAKLEDMGYESISVDRRAMFKDGLGVFLSYTPGGSDEIFLRSWTELSPVAQQFRTISYSPDVWIRKIDAASRV